MSNEFPRRKVEAYKPTVFEGSEPPVNLSWHKSGEGDVPAPGYDVTPESPKIARERLRNVVSDLANTPTNYYDRSIAIRRELKKTQDLQRQKLATYFQPQLQQQQQADSSVRFRKYADTDELISDSETESKLDATPSSTSVPEKKPGLRKKVSNTGYHATDFGPVTHAASVGYDGDPHYPVPTLYSPEQSEDHSQKKEKGNNIHVQTDAVTEPEDKTFEGVQKRLIDKTRATRGDEAADALQNKGIRTTEDVFIKSAEVRSARLDAEKAYFDAVTAHDKKKQSMERMLGAATADTKAGGKYITPEIKKLRDAWIETRKEEVQFANTQVQDNYDKHHHKKDGSFKGTVTTKETQGRIRDKQAVMERYDRRFGKAIAQDALMDAQKLEQKVRLDAFSNREKRSIEKLYDKYQNLPPKVRIASTYAVILGASTIATGGVASLAALTPLALGGASVLARLRGVSVSKKDGEKWFNLARATSLGGAVGLAVEKTTKLGLKGRENKAAKILQKQQELGLQEMLSSNAFDKALKDIEAASSVAATNDRTAKFAGASASVLGGLALGYGIHHVAGNFHDHPTDHGTVHTPHHPTLPSTKIEPHGVPPQTPHEVPTSHIPHQPIAPTPTVHEVPHQAVAHAPHPAAAHETPNPTVTHETPPAAAHTQPNLPPQQHAQPETPAPNHTAHSEDTWKTEIHSENEGADKMFAEFQKKLHDQYPDANTAPPLIKHLLTIKHPHSLSVAFGFVNKAGDASRYMHHGEYVDIENGNLVFHGAHNSVHTLIAEKAGGQIGAPEPLNDPLHTLHHHHHVHPHPAEHKVDDAAPQPSATPEVTATAPDANSSTPEATAPTTSGTDTAPAHETSTTPTTEAASVSPEVMTNAHGVTIDTSKPAVYSWENPSNHKIYQVVDGGDEAAQKVLIEKLLKENHHVPYILTTHADPATGIMKVEAHEFGLQGKVIVPSGQIADPETGKEIPVPDRAEYVPTKNP